MVTLSLTKVSLDLLTVMDLVSLFTISNPLTYAFPGPTPRTNFADASERDNPFTLFVDESNL